MDSLPTGEGTKERDKAQQAIGRTRQGLVQACLPGSSNHFRLNHFHLNVHFIMLAQVGWVALYP